MIAFSDLIYRFLHENLTINYSQCPKIVVGNNLVSSEVCSVKFDKLKRPTLTAGPFLEGKYAWDYNGTNSPQWTGLEKDHYSSPQREFQINIFVTKFIAVI